MGPRSKQDYLKSVRPRYLRASRQEKKKILDEFCQVCGYNRKYAITLLLKGRGTKNKRKGPNPIYNHPAVKNALKHLWVKTGYLCSKRLKAALPLWLPWYQKAMGLDQECADKLRQMSPATMDRYLKKVKASVRLKGRSSTKPGRLLKQHIPIETQKWDTSQPGFLEADTVAHCGASLAGDFAYTLDCVDIATTWTEQRAVWNKGHQGIIAAIKNIEATLPFSLKGFDSDNGSEFLNNSLWLHFTKRKDKVKFTRSRPYKKEDNAHVEQKNWTKVRHLFGYYRIDKPELIPLMNDVYRNEWRLLQNFFTPSVKLISKARFGAKIVKKHDLPKTPYQRVLEHEAVSIETKKKLIKLFDSLNPLALKSSLEAKLNAILKKLG
jgi:hypothetical protein